MFKSARVKLTAWYLLIIMIISLIFSLLIYRALTGELDRAIQIQQARIENALVLGRPAPQVFIDFELVEETKNRIKINLAIINLVILTLSGVAGYFLAGRTLRPIEESLERQKRFISDASHELRTPLTSLRTELEVNIRDTKLNLKDSKNLLKSNLEEVLSLQKIVDSLLILAKNDNQNIAFQTLELAHILSKAIKKVSPLAKTKKIKVVDQTQNIIFKGDENKLVESFVIFLDNAIKYSPPKKEVKILNKKSRNNFQIQIIDQGIGIQKEEQTKIFDRFYRSDKSRTKNDISGFGLGLSIAKKIIDDHHGQILVESKPNNGTIFYITLPLS